MRSGVKVGGQDRGQGDGMARDRSRRSSAGRTRLPTGPLSAPQGAPREEAPACDRIALPEPATQQPSGGKHPLFCGGAPSPAFLFHLGFRHSNSLGRSPHLSRPTRLHPRLGNFPIPRPHPSHRKSVSTMLTQTSPRSKTLADTPQIIANVSAVGAARGKRRPLAKRARTKQKEQSRDKIEEFRIGVRRSPAADLSLLRL